MKLTFDLLSIRRTCVVRVDLLRRRVLIKGHESVEEVFAGCVVVVTTGVIREVISQRRVGKLLREQVDFVQEQNLC